MHVIYIYTYIFEHTYIYTYIYTYYGEDEDDDDDDDAGDGDGDDDDHAWSMPIWDAVFHQSGHFPMGSFLMFLCQLRRLPGPSLVAAEAFGPNECRDEGVSTCCWRRRTIMLWVWWVLLVKAKEIHHAITPAWPKVMQALPKTFDVGHHTILQLPFWLQYIIIIYIYIAYKQNNMKSFDSIAWWYIPHVMNLKVFAC